MAWRRLVFLAALLLAAPATAEACSLAGDYVRPSNFELVQIAEAIVIARPERRIGRGDDSRLLFRVEAAVKGAPPERVALDAELGRTQPSDLENLSESHPEGHSGPCDRTTFSRQGRYLLFLERAPDGSWQQLGHAFSRISEDYAGEDNGWMRSVRRYLRLQQTLAPMDQVAALRTMAETGRDTDGHPLSAGERADIADHLGSVSQWKPTLFLLDIYDRIARDERLAFEPRSNAANGEGGEVDRLLSLTTGEEAGSAAEGPRRERLMVLRALAEGDHPGALALFERLWSAPDADSAVRGIALRYFARNGQYSRAYGWIETRLLAELPSLSERDATALIRDVARVQQGDSYEPGGERWRADRHAAATWPELALALYWYQVRTFGSNRALSFRDALGAIDATDYRARPDLTVALAANFDPGALSWAIAELDRTSQDRGPRGGSGEDHPAWLPLRAVAAAWSSNHYPLLIRTFCEGGERRRLVILALGEDGPGLYRDLLGGMAGFPGLSQQEQSWVAAAIDRMTARERRSTGPINPYDYGAEHPRPVRCRGRR